ncbi:MAG: SEC-C domain-containing protein [Myxococcota bacterium]|nr:SEC-C domain-containing protein [Myxococcota bacterium]
MKLGRNEPCHCGSGKKYKRCCLRKDESERSAPPPVPEAPEEGWQDDPWDEDPEGFDPFEDDDEEHDSVEEWEDVPNLLLYREKYACKKFDDSIPEISEEDQMIVDDWWEGFDKIYSENNFDQQECLARIKDFAAEHPRLTPNLQLHEEALFEIGDAFLRADYTTYIDFLKWFRQNCFEAYRLSGTFYDNAVVSYCLVHGLRDDISEYFSIYKEYPDRDPDGLMALITLLQVTGNDRPLVSLLEDIYLNIYYSPSVIGGHTFVFPMVTNAWGKHAKADYSEADLDALLYDLQVIVDKVPHFRLRTERDYWSKVLKQTFTRTFDDDYPTEKSDIETYYGQIGNHFKGYLHTVKHKTWQCADYLTSSIFEYLDAQLSKNKRPKNTFRFTRDGIDKHIRQNYRAIFSVMEVPSLACIDALLYFTEYMRQENLITTDVAVLNRRACLSLFDDIYRHFEKSCFGARLFENLKERHMQ